MHVLWVTDFKATLNPNEAQWSEIDHHHANFILNHINLDGLIAENREDEVEEESEVNQRDQDLHEWMLYARLQPEQEIPQAELGLREIDTAYNWSESFGTYQQPNQLRNFINDQQSTHQQNVDLDLNMPAVLLSPEQEKVLDVVRSQIHYLRTGIRTQQFRQSAIIQGKAGSGKLTLIQAIKANLNQEFGPDSFVILAPTRAAAMNIRATTIHSTLKISTDHTLNLLTPASLQDLQENLRNCKFVIIDEISLLGCSLFKKVDLRLREAKGLVNTEFGGMFLLLLGDLK